jgi:hypothetical protein
MKVAGAFVNPNGMTNHWKRPSLDLKFGMTNQLVGWEPGGSHNLGQSC